MLCRLIRPQVSALREAGFRVAVFNPRGIGIPQVTKNLLDFSKVNKDLDFVLNHIEEKFPEGNRYIVGFSLGASYGLKYVSKEGRDRNIKGFVSIGNPFDVYAALNHTTTFPGNFYGGLITRKLKKIVAFNKTAITKKAKEADIDFDFDQLQRVSNVFDFNREYTFKFLAQNDHKQYFDSLSCVDNIRDVNMPVFVINAKNDPIAR